jgi:DNA-directed RNA polymerase subunit omega
MAHVPIEDIMEHVDSKYRLVIVAAKRAKQLNRGAAPLVQVRNVKPTYQALEEVATGKLGYEMESLTGEAARELEPGGKPTWYRSLSAEEVVPEEVVAEAEERFEEEEVPVEAPIAGGAAEDLLMNEFEEEGLDELGDLEVIEPEDTEE